MSGLLISIGVVLAGYLCYKVGYVKGILDGVVSLKEELEKSMYYDSISQSYVDALDWLCSMEKKDGDDLELQRFISKMEKELRPEDVEFIKKKFDL